MKDLSTLSFALAVVTSSLSWVTSALAVEPAYCAPDRFVSHETSYQKPSGTHVPSRLHVYQLGTTKLAGMAVGQSEVRDVVAAAGRLSSGATAAQNHCTWYFNDGNVEARRTFNWFDLPKPTGSNYEEMGDRYVSLMGGVFDRDAVNMVDCATRYRYIGMGCDGMKHRGPSVFAMLLAYSGCTPAHSAEIVNRVWGNNGIKTEMRESLAERARLLALERPEKSAALRAAFESMLE